MQEGLIDKHDHHHDHEHEHHHDHSHDHSHDHGHKHEHQESGNINLTSAYLHVLGDMLMSVGVVIASIIIYLKPEYHIADPLCTYLFSIIICVTTIPVFKECVNVMLEATP